MLTDRSENISDDFGALSPAAPEFDTLDSGGLAGGMERSGFSKYSLRRKSIQTFLLLVTVIALAGAASGLSLFAPVEWSVWRWTLTAVCCLCLLAAVVAIAGYIKNGLRTVMLEEWIRRMGEGDLEFRADPGGKDEVKDVAIALEELRQRSIKVVQLGLVEQMAEDLKARNDELARVLSDLLTAQDQIVARQKLAEMGELTAGVAHEIRNPLNFVINFSQTSAELVSELSEILDAAETNLDTDAADEIVEIRDVLLSNMGRIVEHCDRANRIVETILALGKDTGNLQPTDLNNLLSHHAELAYQSARALDDSFEMKMVERFDPEIDQIMLAPEGMARVILNMVGNSCYAVTERKRSADCDADYVPTLWLETRLAGDEVEIVIRDNGSGIPSDAISKVLNPFFTTKPPDIGAGLGLSQSADIVRRHGGRINVVSEIGQYTEMTIVLPVEGSPAYALSGKG